MLPSESMTTFGKWLSLLNLKLTFGRFYRTQVWQAEYNKQSGIIFHHILKCNSLKIKGCCGERGPASVLSFMQEETQFNQMSSVLISVAVVPGLTLFFQLFATPFAKTVPKKKIPNELKGNEPVSFFALNMSFSRQTLKGCPRGSELLSYYFLNGFQPH